MGIQAFLIPENQSKSGKIATQASPNAAAGALWQGYRVIFQFWAIFDIKNWAVSQSFKATAAHIFCYRFIDTSPMSHAAHGQDRARAPHAQPGNPETPNPADRLGKDLDPITTSS